MICVHTTHDSDTVNHIKTEYEESLDDWLLFLDVTIDIFFQNCSSVDSQWVIYYFMCQKYQLSK